MFPNEMPGQSPVIDKFRQEAMQKFNRQQQILSNMNELYAKRLGSGTEKESELASLRQNIINQQKAVQKAYSDVAALVEVTPFEQKDSNNLNQQVIAVSITNQTVVGLKNDLSNAQNMLRESTLPADKTKITTLITQKQTALKTALNNATREMSNYKTLAAELSQKYKTNLPTEIPLLAADEQELEQKTWSMEYADFVAKGVQTEMQKEFQDLNAAVQAGQLSAEDPVYTMLQTRVKQAQGAADQASKSYMALAQELNARYGTNLPTQVPLYNP